jgi:hypothetical protein
MTLAPRRCLSSKRAERRRVLSRHAQAHAAVLGRMESESRANHRWTRLGSARMKSFNLYGDEWDEERDREGWRIKEAFVGHHIGGGLIGASMSELQPGSKLWPHHTHHANEESVIVLRGEPTLRTPEGRARLNGG